MADGITIRWNRSELDAALRRLNNVSRWSPAKSVNQATYRVFQKATWHMKVVQATTIESELQAGKAMEKVLVGRRGIGKGLRWSKAKANLKYFFGSASAAPLLALIIQSRTVFGSNPSAKGGLSPWYGVSRQEGARRMLEKMRRVMGARLKSRGYFKAAFATLRDFYKRSAGNRIPFSDPASRGSGTESAQARDFGRIVNATAATGTRAVARFQVNSPRHDIKEAIYKYAAPVLEQAMAEEAAWTFQKAIELEYREACKLAGIKVR